MTEYLPHGDQTFRIIRDGVWSTDDWLQRLEAGSIDDYSIRRGLEDAAFSLPHGDEKPWIRVPDKLELLDRWGDESNKDVPPTWDSTEAVKLAPQLYRAVGQILEGTPAVRVKATGKAATLVAKLKRLTGSPSGQPPTIPIVGAAAEWHDIEREFRRVRKPNDEPMPRMHEASYGWSILTNGGDERIARLCSKAGRLLLTAPPTDSIPEAAVAQSSDGARWILYVLGELKRGELPDALLPKSRRAALVIRDGRMADSQQLGGDQPAATPAPEPKLVTVADVVKMVSPYSRPHVQAKSKGWPAPHRKARGPIPGLWQYDEALYECLIRDCPDAKEDIPKPV